MPAAYPGPSYPLESRPIWLMSDGFSGSWPREPISITRGQYEEAEEYLPSAERPTVSVGCYGVTDSRIYQLMPAPSTLAGSTWVVRYIVQDQPTQPTQPTLNRIQRAMSGRERHSVYSTDHVTPPKMSKKQFDYLAFMLAKTRPKASARWSSDVVPVGKAKRFRELDIPLDAVASWERVVAEFITGLEATNTQFSREKFREAVSAKIRSQEDER